MKLEQQSSLLTVSASGKVTGDYWQNISNLESRKANELYQKELEATSKPTEQRKLSQTPKVYQHSERTFEGKLERYGEAVMSMRSQGKSVDHICKVIGMGARTIARIIKELVEEGR
jgi:hypothetical protein